MDRVKSFSDSRDLCDALVDNGYQPSYGGWYEKGEIRVGFHDDSFKHIDVEYRDYVIHELPITEVFYDGWKGCYATDDIRLF